MNVEFRCPSCHHRLMAPPAGGKGAVIRRTCTNPNCTPDPEKGNRYVQIEEWGGPVSLPTGRELPRYDFIAEDREGGTFAGREGPEGGIVGVALNRDEMALAALGTGDEAKIYCRERITELGGKVDGRMTRFESLREELFKLLDEKSPLPQPDTSMRDGQPS